MVKDPRIFRPNIYHTLKSIELLIESEYGKCELQMAANMNYQMYLTYLEILKNAGWISYERSTKNHIVIKITEIGRKAHYDISRWYSQRGIKIIPQNSQLIPSNMMNTEEQ